MEEKKYTQQEILNLMNRYNATNRQIIKANLKRILSEQDIKPKQIIELGYKSPNVYAWLAPTAPNIPMFDQALNISVMFGFNIKELIQGDEII